MKISIFTTCSNPIERKDIFFESLSSYREIADELILVDGSKTPRDIYQYGFPKLWDKTIYHRWPEDFSWEFIGQQFQRGYDACTGDWVIRVDLDFIFHESNIEALKRNLNLHKDKPGVSFPKRQFIIADRYNVKSRLVLALNKGVFGNRIKLNAGGDLCQASLDDNLLSDENCERGSAVIWNYDYLLKTQEVVAKEAARFGRAWKRCFGRRDLGTGKNAFEMFLKMQINRMEKPNAIIPLEEHPKYIQETIRNLKPENFGYNGWGNLPTCHYFLDPIELPSSTQESL